MTQPDHLTHALKVGDEEALRRILRTSADTARDLKIARAESVLRHANLKAAEMWATVDIDTDVIARRADDADVERRLLWMLHQILRGGTSITDEPSEAA